MIEIGGEDMQIAKTYDDNSWNSIFLFCSSVEDCDCSVVL